MNSELDRIQLSWPPQDIAKFHFSHDEYIVGPNYLLPKVIQDYRLVNPILNLFQPIASSYNTYRTNFGTKLARTPFQNNII